MTGARFDLQRFNVQLLSYGSAPVKVIEQMMDKKAMNANLAACGLRL
jgi:uncharacterized protein (DUF885 family)